MQFRKEDRSIFPENFVEMQGVQGSNAPNDALGDMRRDDILSEIEFLNAKVMRSGGHALSKNAELEEAESVNSRNSISDLVKMGHRLPEVEAPEKMLISEESAVRQDDAPAEAQVSKSGIAPYRIVNLISGSYKLPEIDDESFFR